MNKVEIFLKELRESSDLIYVIFIDGSCFKLFKILSTVFKDCKAYWSDKDFHCIVEIDNEFYDIGGKLSKKYVTDRKYFRIKDRNLKYYDLYKHTDKTNNRSVNINKYLTYE